MFAVEEYPEIHATDDGFALAKDSTRVEPAKFLQHTPHGHLVMDVVIDALASAAADDGSLLHFDIRAFFDEHITEAMGRSPDDPPLKYDSFTAMTLMEAFMWLQARGLLAHRGNGDSYDYWLAAPASD